MNFTRKKKLEREQKYLFLILFYGGEKILLEK